MGLVYFTLKTEPATKMKTFSPQLIIEGFSRPLKLHMKGRIAANLTTQALDETFTIQFMSNKANSFATFGGNYPF